MIRRAGDGKVTLVLDADNGDCSGCAIASLCSKGQEVTIDYPDATPDMVGRMVDVSVSAGLRHRATVLYLLIPVLLLTAVLVAVALLRWGDTIAALTAVAVVALWYGLLYLLRGRLKSGKIQIVG